MDVRSLIGFLLAGAAGVVACYVSVALLVIAFVVLMRPADVNAMDTVIKSALQPGAGLFFVSAFVIAGLCSIFEGYLAALIAGRDELLVGILSSYLFVGLRLYWMMSIKSTYPMWGLVLAGVLPPILGLFGGYARSLERSLAPN